MRIKKFKAFMYLSLWKITEMKGDSIFSTEFVGYIHKDDKDKYLAKEYTFSSISTKLTGLPSDTIDLEPFIGK